MTDPLITFLSPRTKVYKVSLLDLKIKIKKSTLQEKVQASIYIDALEKSKLRSYSMNSRQRMVMVDRDRHAAQEI